MKRVLIRFDETILKTGLPKRTFPTAFLIKISGVTVKNQPHEFRYPVFRNLFEYEMNVGGHDAVRNKSDIRKSYLYAR